MQLNYIYNNQISLADWARAMYTMNINDTRRKLINIKCGQKPDELQNLFWVKLAASSRIEMELSATKIEGRLTSFTHGCQALKQTVRLFLYNLLHNHQAEHLETCVFVHTESALIHERVKLQLTFCTNAS